MTNVWKVLRAGREGVLSSAVVRPPLGLLYMVDGEWLREKWDGVFAFADAAQAQEFADGLKPSCEIWKCETESVHDVTHVLATYSLRWAVTGAHDKWLGLIRAGKLSSAREYAKKAGLAQCCAPHGTVLCDGLRFIEEVST